MSKPADGGPSVAAGPSPDELSRKVKRLESNQKDWAAETQKELRRQKQEIAQLKKDNEQLKMQLSQAQAAGFGIARSAAGASPIRPTSGTGRRMQKVKEMDVKKETCDNLSDAIMKEQHKISDLTAKLDAARSQVKSSRISMGGVNVTKESNIMITNQVHVLENRLDKALVKFNEALHVNKALREQIDSLRRERGVFDTIYKKLERELQEKKKEMAFIIEVSNIAYEERDNAQSELAQLKMYASKELHSFDETFKELDELLEEDRKMKEAIRARMVEAIQKSKKDESVKSGALSDDDAGSPTGTKKSKKGAHSPKTSQGGAGGAGAGGAVGGPGGMGSSGDIGLTRESAEEAFQKIRAATNMTDINQLVNKFLHSEDDNFSLFNYVNELNNEIEKLEEGKLEIKAEIERVKGNMHGQGDNSRRAVLKQLEEKLQLEETNSRKYQQLAEQSAKLLEQIMVSVDKLFATLECDEQMIAEQQGVSGLSENTLQAYLAAIETKADEHLTKWRRSHGAPERGPAFPFGATNISIDIPTTGDDYNDGYSDEDEKVLTRAELLAKTNQKIFKQQQQQAVLEGMRKGGKRGAQKKKLGPTASIAASTGGPA